MSDCARWFRVRTEAWNELRKGGEDVGGMREGRRSARSPAAFGGMRGVPGTRGVFRGRTWAGAAGRRRATDRGASHGRFEARKSATRLRLFIRGVRHRFLGRGSVGGRAAARVWVRCDVDGPAGGDRGDAGGGRVVAGVLARGANGPGEPESRAAR